MNKYPALAWIRRIHSMYRTWDILRLVSSNPSFSVKILWSILQQCPLSFTSANTSISSLGNTGADENDVFPSFPALLSYDGFRKGDTQFVNRIRGPVQPGRDQFSSSVTVSLVNGNALNVTNTPEMHKWLRTRSRHYSATRAGCTCISSVSNLPDHRSIALDIR